MTERFADVRRQVEAASKELEEQLTKAKAEAKGASTELIKTLEQRITELRGTLINGWEDMTDDIAVRLKEWLQKLRD